MSTEILSRVAREEPLRFAQFMRGFRVVFSRELAAYFDSPIAYIYTAVFLVLSCTTFMNSFFLAAIVDMSAYFEVLPFLLIPFIPAITMRTWAEEHAQHTFEMLMTLPLHPLQVVLGKYAAALAFYSIVLMGSLPIVIMLVFLGQPDLGLIAANYLGAFLLGAFFLSFGLLASGMTRDQIVAFVLATLLGFVFVLSGHEKVVEVLDGLAPALQLGTWFYESVSVLPHYQVFGRGVVALADLVYFLLMSGFFVLMNYISLQRTRY
ncbi:MAG: ABC-2 type transport system permease protein [Candidatus Latescibacterota bacterium]|jgi:ABC-2 type transport system permease protein